MNDWISVKDRLPEDDSFVYVKIVILFPSKKKVMYCNKYFISRGENITKWVTHWKPELVAPIVNITKDEFKKLYPNVENDK